MSAPTINYTPQGESLRRFHESDAYCRVVVGPLGSGKTHAMIVEMLLQIVNQVPDANKVRRSRILVVRNSWPELATTVIADFNAIIGVTGLGELKQTAPAQWNANFPLGDGTTVDAQVLFMGFDGQDDQRKARGMQLSGVWLNEAAELSKANIDLIMSRVGRYPSRAAVTDAKRFVIMDSNACARDSWLARLCLDEKPDSWDVFLQPGAVRRVNGKWQVDPEAENLRNLRADYYQNQLAGKTDQWIRRNLANEFVHTFDGQPVHPDFRESGHVREVEIDPGLPLLVGLDFGRTPAAVFGQKLPSGRWIITHELVTENMSAVRFGPLLMEKIAGCEELNNCYSTRITGDPAGEQHAQTRDETVFEVLETVGVYAEPASTNDFGVRTNSLDRLLTQMIEGEPAFAVHPRCKTLIRGLAGDYHFRRLKVAGDDRYESKPNKNFSSHVVESCHYMLLGSDGDLLSLAAEWEEANEYFEESWALPDRYFE